jgi:CRP/FNR family cyclic AMP-dependent transcriptional regulator
LLVAERGQEPRDPGVKVEERQAWYVKDSGFMKRVDPQDRDVFLNICPERKYQPGETIFHEGDPASALHIVAMGKVKLVRSTMDGRERILAICGPDDFIGEAFLKEADSYRADAVALSQTTTCPIDRDQFKLVAARAPGFALTFAEVLASHLHSCHDQLSASYDSVKVRVAKIVLDQAQRFGRPLVGNRCLLETELKHEDIAALASATRVAVTMAFTDLREEGLITGSRGRYELDFEMLRQLAEGGSAD